jgi:hypothetical protein
MSMRCRVSAFVFFAFVAFAAHAQAANPFVGTWDVTIPRVGHGYDKIPALLVVTADGGRWRIHAYRAGPCASAEVPVQITSVDEKRLVGTVMYSSAAEYCKDVPLELTRNEKGHVTGRYGQMEVTLTKK